MNSENENTERLKPWYTAYDFEELRERMSPAEKQIFEQGKDTVRMSSITQTILREMKRGAGLNIKVRCPACQSHGPCCSIKVSNGLFHCWKCGQMNGQLHELAALSHSEGCNIDAGYYTRACQQKGPRQDADYIPVVASDYVEVSPEVRRKLVELGDESSSENVSPKESSASARKPAESVEVVSLRQQVRAYLHSIGISVATARQAGVMCAYMSRKADDSKSHDPHGYEPVPAIAYCNRLFGRIVNVKMRSVALDPLTGEYSKDFYQEAPFKPCAPYGIDSINPLRPDALPIDRLIITEGEKDRLTLMECGFPYVLSVASGAQTNLAQSHEAFEEWIAQARDIVVCGDSDKPGRSLVKRLLERYGDRASLAELPTGCKDISEAYALYGSEVVRRIIENPKDLGMANVYTVQGHEDDIMQVMLGIYDRGYDVGMGELTDQVLHLTSAGGLIVVSGEPNSGKTDFLNCLMAHLIFKRQKKVAFFSFELPDKRKHFRNMARLALGEADLRKFVISPQTHEVDPRLVDQILRPVSDYLAHHMVDFQIEEGLPSTSHIRNLAEKWRLRHGLDFLVIDPYLFIVADQGNERLTETQQVRDILTKLQSWSRKHGVWTVVVAHPRKMEASGQVGKKDVSGYDIAGSANWLNLADFLFVVKRVRDESKRTLYSMMQMLKVRDQEFCQVGEVYYTRQECGRYDERESEQACLDEVNGNSFPHRDEEAWGEIIINN